MNYFDNQTNENFIIFDLNKFITTQKNIYKKYLLKNTNYKNSKTIINTDIIDKYFFQIIEEIFECDKEDSIDKIIEESIDILMYCGSTLNLLDNSLLNNINKLYYPNLINRYNYDIKETYHNTMKKLFDNLLSLRRLFPERKWHKKFNVNDILEERFLIFRDIIIKNINILNEEIFLPNSFNNNDNISFTGINNLINYKQNYILEL